MLGLGTWKTDPGVVSQIVEAALRVGYRHFDCAAIYGNEKEIGEALSALPVPRSELFITSKLWNSEHAPKDVGPAVEQTLLDLKLDYLDLYLVHWPQAFAKVDNTHIGRPKHANGSMIYDFETSLESTWAAMENLVARGLVKAIGLSNFNQEQIEAILRVARIKPAVLQIESHPFLAQKPLLDFCQTHGIVVTAYSPLGSGAAMQGHPIPSHPVLREIGARHDVTAAQVAIAWQLKRGVIVIPKSVTIGRLRENMDAMTVPLTDADMDRIAALDSGRRVGWGGPFVRGKPRDMAHPLYPFRWQPPPKREL